MHSLFHHVLLYVSVLLFLLYLCLLLLLHPCLQSSQNGLTEAFLQLADWCSVLEESVLRCVSKYSQLTNVFRILNRCVFPMVQ